MSRFLDDMAREIKRLNLNILRIAETSPDGPAEAMDLKPASICLNSYSVSKAFTAAAVGILYDRGLLRMDERVTDILRAYLPERYDPRWHDMTVDMALRHFCGFKPGYLDIDTANLNPVTGGDYLRYLFNTPLECPPGTQYCYSDAAFYLISRVVTEKTGAALDTFLWETLFMPLGFREVAWSRCPHGYAMGATGLYVNTADMVKLGALYMNGGVWQGGRILSQEWVRLSLERQYGLNPHRGGAYGKGGMLGQIVLLLPAQNRAVAWHGMETASLAPLIDWTLDYAP